MSERDYSYEKKILLEMLPSKDVDMIKKKYPIRHDRNAKIRELVQRGVSYNVLADLTGLSKAQLWQIGNYSRAVRKLSNDEQSLKNDLNKIQDAVSGFCKEIRKILKHRRKLS